MRDSCRFSMAVHMMTVLGHRARNEVVRPLTSAEMAASINTNPVIVRRLLASLGTAGLVGTRPGNRGGAWLERASVQITLDDIYRAVEPDEGLIAVHERPNQECPVGSVIGNALHTAIGRAEAALHASLADTSLEDILVATEQYCPKAEAEKADRLAAEAAAAKIDAA
jgi:DNA-binding IscR family transcriptional regulator